MVADSANQLSIRISLQPKAKRENHMISDITKRAKSKQHCSKALLFCISYLLLLTDRFLTPCFKGGKKKLQKAVAKSSPAECLMKSHFLCSQHQDQMTIFGGTSIHKKVSSLKTGTGIPKQLFKYPGQGIMSQ